MAKFGVLIYKSNQKKTEFSCVFKNHERRKKKVH